MKNILSIIGIISIVAFLTGFTEIKNPLSERSKQQVLIHTEHNGVGNNVINQYFKSGYRITATVSYGTYGGLIIMEK